MYEQLQKCLLPENMKSISAVELGENKTYKHKGKDIFIKISTLSMLKILIFRDFSGFSVV